MWENPPWQASFLQQAQSPSAHIFSDHLSVTPSFCQPSFLYFFGHRVLPAQKDGVNREELTERWCDRKMRETEEDGFE